MSRNYSQHRGPKKPSKFDSASLDSGCMDSGFLSENIDSASCSKIFTSSSRLVSSEIEHSSSSHSKCEKKILNVCCSDSGVIESTDDIIEEEEEEAACRREEVSQLLLEEAFCPDEDGDTNLHSAIIKGSIEAVFSLVRLAPSSKYLNVRNGCHLTPLHTAVLSGQPWAVRRLVIAGASLTSVDRRGNTALHMACCLGDSASVRCLTSPVTTQEASVCPSPHPVARPSGVKSVLDLRNSDGLTCLQLAALNGHPLVAAHLIALGADPDCPEGRTGRTAAHISAEVGSADMCRLLADLGADMAAKSWQGLTPADSAVLNGHLALGEFLCQLGSCYTPRDDDEEEGDESSDSEAEMDY